MTPTGSALLIWALLANVPEVTAQAPTPRENGQRASTSVQLTNELPTASFPVDAQTVARAPAILELSITKVVNPVATPFQIAVYLSRAAENILVGDVSLYPPDQPAGFRFSVSAAFRQLRAAGAPSQSSAVRLLLEMRRIRKAEPWTTVEVTVASPTWRLDER